MFRTLRSPGCRTTTLAVLLALIVGLGLPVEALAAPAGTATGPGNTTHLNPRSSLGVRQQACPCTLWSDAAVPSLVAQTDNSAVEVGIKFRVTTPGFITGIRFYKSSTNVGMHLGHLWSRDGQLLAQAMFTNESASGWQRVSFSSPVPISANTTYVASYHTDVGFYSVNQDYFATTGHQFGPLRALGNGEDGPNGVYRYGASGFPSDSYRSSNYWVTPVFTTDLTGAGSPGISRVEVTEITTNSVTVRWQTDEPSDSRVDFGPSPSYGSQVSDGSFVTAHVIRLAGLTSNSVYYVRARSRTAAGDQTESGSLTFTTSGPPPTVPAPTAPAPTAPAPTAPNMAVCQPRPPVLVSAVPGSPGQLLVTVTAGTLPGTPANRLAALRFEPGSNALVDIGDQSGRTGGITVTLADRPRELRFAVRRARPGASTTVPFVVVDDCGEYRSFVGGGPGAF
jgi:hypothetical protein